MRVVFTVYSVRGVARALLLNTLAPDANAAAKIIVPRILNYPVHNFSRGVIKFISPDSAGN